MNTVFEWFKHLNVMQMGALAAGLMVVFGALIGAVRALLGGAKMPSIVTTAAAQQSLARGFCAWMAGNAMSIWHGLDYLATRREWRYQQPWVLMLGERGAGKTSLLRSVSVSLQQAPPARAAELVAQGSQWLYFRGGVVIDVDGKLPAAAEGSAPAQAWRRSLTELKGLRPERPLDGLMLCISAPTLLTADVEQRMALAKNLYQQLAYLQQRTEFMLPVTVVVTQCDSIEGFDAFWRAQPLPLRKELFGFSASANSQSSAPTAWTENAFTAMGERLRALQVDAAARTDHIHSADAFFLFPGYFENLRVPLGVLLETVFRQSAWQAGYLLRGLYFTGGVEAGGELEGRVRNDVDFVDALLAERVLVERNLARPTRNGLFSRNKLIRSVQISAIVVVVALSVALVFAGSRVKAQVSTLTSAIAQLKRAAPDAVLHGDCLGKDEVYPLLVDVARINDRTHYWTIPVSWVDTRVMDNSDASIERTTIDVVLMPTLACWLEVHARKMWTEELLLPPDQGKGALQDLEKWEALQSLRARFNTKLKDVSELEENLARFDTLRDRGGQLSRAEVLNTLAGLANYVFGASVPEEVLHEHGALSRAFNTAQASALPVLPKDMRERFAEHLQKMGKAVRISLSQEIALGAQLMESLKRGEAPVLGNTRRLAKWLSWTNESWLSSRSTSNPCEDIRASVQPQVDILTQRYGYAHSLTAVGQQFDKERCYKPGLVALGELSIAPYGNIFTVGPKGGLSLSANLQGELLGLPALVQLNFMRLENPRSFVCMPGSEGFRHAETAEAAGFVAEYAAFVKKQKLSPAIDASRPLYDKLARRALEQALGDSLQRAQIAPTEPPVGQVNLESVTRADLVLSRMSGELSRSLDPLLNVARSYGELGFEAGATKIRQCSRDFAAESLSRISALADVSRLYVPPAAVSTEMLFDIGSLPIAKEYLSRQVARAQVLAGYATPFMNLLQGSQSVSDTQRSVPQTASFWRNSIDELNRYMQGKDPVGQVANLDNYFIKQLGDLSYGNCQKLLAAYKAPEYGDDMFSERRRPLEKLVNQRCSNRRVAQAVEVYSALAQRFNRELAGRYPFADAAAPDARLAAVRSFFLDYDAQRAALGEALDGLTADRWQAAQQFVKELDAISLFFRSNVSAPESGEAVRLSLVFRAQPKLSQGSEQIVAWLLSSGSRAAGFPNRPSVLDWQTGESLAVDLTWASRSSWSPVTDKQQPDLMVEGNTATFVASGTWSLLRFIETHRVEDDGNRKQLMLGFTVPQQSEVVPGKSERGRARLFIAMQLLGGDNKAPDRPLRLPASFPHKAPGND